MKVVLWVINFIILGIIISYLIPLADIYLGNGLGDLVIMFLLLLTLVVSLVFLLFFKSRLNFSLIIGLVQIIMLVFIIMELRYWHWLYF